MRAARVDANQTQVVSALRGAGATVQSLAAIGKGCPDLLVAFRDGMFLLELKHGKGKTNDLQKKNGTSNGERPCTWCTGRKRR